MDRRGFLTGALSVAGLFLADPVAAAAGRPAGPVARPIAVRVPGFRPSANGLHFPNLFPHVPVLEVDLLGVRIPLGDAADGLCGGMVYAVRDMFEAGLSPPRSTGIPGDGPILRFLAQRLLASWSLPFGPLTYLELMHPAVPDGDRPRIRGRAWRMISVEWPAIRADLDRGILCPLGLIRIKSRNPLHIAHNHQVLAWGYDLDGTHLTLHIYDPNHPDDDDVTLTLDIADPCRPTRVHCSHGGRVWCLFRTDYRFIEPHPALTGRHTEHA